jgi:hypothetical protein
MKTWTSKELTDLAAADQMELATARPDGSLRRPVTIWVVRYGGDLYVRSWRGRASRWFRGSQDCHEGHIRAGGVDRDVGFVDVGDSVRHPIDAAYRTKYRRYGSRYVDPMVSPKARAATIKLLPR